MDSLVNRGTERNLGVEITLERFFTGSYYYLATLSLFDSKYKASDAIIRNTAFNGNYVVKMLGGYEFSIRNKNALSIDLKFTWAGRLRFIPIDLDQSITKGETVYDFGWAFEESNPDYYRLDLRIAFKMNRPRCSQEWALEMSNITNHHNRFLNNTTLIREWSKT
ncbi:MAG: TonB-dependent receptor [Bacteroidales bacterium]|nr:TonB-dependent receptor [Bacteroidales bacterium]